ncbi:MAG: DUF2254 domain-containing protein [Rhodococcus sp. (in: high G+C Gram-positive bacteria)]
MKAKFARFSDVFWFLPLTLGVVAVILAQVLIAVDRLLDGADLGLLTTLLYRVGASGSRSILQAIGGSMLAVAATSFSITVSVLATASSTYGPRLVRNFMRDRANQFVLGIFGSTFLYSLMVLRSIGDESVTDGPFVPTIAVNVAVLLAVLDVAVLVFFINHIATSIQVSTLSARVRTELVAVVDTLYPEEHPDNAVPGVAPDKPFEEVSSRTSGFLLDINEAALLRAASSNDAVIEVRVRPGDHIVDGEPLARVFPPNKAAEVADSIRSAVNFGVTRTPHHDIQFAVQQLVEMAVRALSPGTNDPYTAHNALNELATGLVPMARRPAPQLGRVDGDRTLRLLVTRLPMTELVDDVFVAVRLYALDAAVAMTAAIMLAKRIGIAAVDPDVRDAVLRHLGLIEAAEKASGSDIVNVVYVCGEIDLARKAVLAR